MSKEKDGEGGFGGDRWVGVAHGYLVLLDRV